MKITELYRKYVDEPPVILLEFSPGKRASLIQQFSRRHPEISERNIEWIIDRYSALLTARKRDGGDIITGEDRDIDRFIENRQGDGWTELLDLALDNTLLEDVPPALNLIDVPSTPTLVCEVNNETHNFKVWEASTRLKCLNFKKDILLSYPIYVQNNAHPVDGRRVYFWCVCDPTGESYYFRYRLGTAGEAPRSFYFIIDFNRLLTDPHHAAVIQPFQQRYGTNDLKLTSALNNGDTPMSYEELFVIYPGLRDHLNSIQFMPLDLAEKSVKELQGKQYTRLDANRAATSDSYIQRWFMANPNLNIPFKRFLALNLVRQQAFINSRDPAVFYNCSMQSKYDTTGRSGTSNCIFTFTDAELAEIGYAERHNLFFLIKMLTSKGKRNLAKNLVRLHNRMPNADLIRVDAQGNPTFRPDGELQIDNMSINNVVICEKLPQSHTSIYVELSPANRAELYSRNSQGEKISVNVTTLSQRDKDFITDMRKVIKLIQLYRESKQIHGRINR